ncbi:MAG: hypothetical protein ABEJ74_06290 [Haloferacaceae archaeon]
MGTSDNPAYETLGPYRRRRVDLRLALLGSLDALFGHALLGHASHDRATLDSTATADAATTDAAAGAGADQ